MAASPRPPERFENVNLLRAAAALLVLVYHVTVLADWRDFPHEGPLVAFRIGWMGVDLFFVVSGFVITYSAVLLRRAAEGAFWREYWRRRLSRIVPLYVVAILLWIAIYEQPLLKGPASELAIQLATHLTFTHGFWTHTHGAVLGPTWSLSTEMQFYLVVALLIGWIDRTDAWRIALYCLLIAWGWRFAMLLAHGHRPPYVLFVKVTQLPGTLDEFAAGIVAAKWVLSGGQRSARAAVAWIVAAVVAGWLCFAAFWPRASYWDHAWMVVFWRTALAVAFGCVLMAALHLPAALARVWLRPLDAAGEVSYGIYLWHMFALYAAIAWVGKDGPLVLVVTVIGTLALAAVSWHLLEKPCMRWGRSKARAPAAAELAAQPPQP